MAYRKLVSSLFKQVVQFSQRFKLSNGSHIEFYRMKFKFKSDAVTESETKTITTAEQDVVARCKGRMLGYGKRRVMWLYLTNS